VRQFDRKQQVGANASTDLPRGQAFARIDAFLGRDAPRPFARRLALRRVEVQRFSFPADLSSLDR
jgi:hypothetical protein